MSISQDLKKNLLFNTQLVHHYKHKYSLQILVSIQLSKYAIKITLEGVEITDWNRNLLNLFHRCLILTYFFDPRKKSTCVSKIKKNCVIVWHPKIGLFLDTRKPKCKTKPDISTPLFKFLKPVVIKTKPLNKNVVKLATNTHIFKQSRQNTRSVLCIPVTALACVHRLSNVNARILPTLRTRDSVVILTLLSDFVCVIETRELASQTVLPLPNLVYVCPKH